MHRFIFVNICQQMLAIAMFLLLQTTTIGAQELLQAVMETLNNNVLFNENPLSKIRADSTTSCSPETNTVRAPILHKVKGREVLFYEQNKGNHPLLFLKQVNTVHLQKVMESNLRNESNQICLSFEEIRTTKIWKMLRFYVSIVNILET